MSITHFGISGHFTAVVPAHSLSLPPPPYHDPAACLLRRDKKKNFKFPLQRARVAQRMRCWWPSARWMEKSIVFPTSWKFLGGWMCACVMFSWKSGKNQTRDREREKKSLNVLRCALFAFLLLTLWITLQWTMMTLGVKCYHIHIHIYAVDSSFILHFLQWSYRFRVSLDWQRVRRRCKTKCELFRDHLKVLIGDLMYANANFGSLALVRW